MSEQTVSQWIKQISKGKKRISKELENKLFAIYTSDASSEKERREALDELVRYNALPIADLALQVYHRFPHGNKVPIVDLCNCGVSAFIERLPRFNPSKGRLITFYSRDVKTKMQRYVIKNASSIVYGSVYLQHLASKLVKAVRELEQTLRRRPTIQEITEHMGISAKTLEFINKYTGITIHGVNGLEYMSVDSGQSKVVDILMDVLREKLDVLDDTEFQSLVLNLYEGDRVDEDIISKIKSIEE